MTVNISGLIGIIFFYIVISGIGLILTYKKHWILIIWNFLKCKKRNSINRHDEENNQEENFNDKNNIKKEKNDRVDLPNRSLGLLIAGWVGGGFITGTSEEVFNNGVFWTTAPFGFSLSGLMFSKIMRNRNYITMIDPFQHRYGDLIGATFLIPAFIAELFWSYSILLSLATALSLVLDLPLKLSVGISAILTVLVSMFGGLALIANTDLVQLSLVFLSLWICIPIIFSNKLVDSVWNNIDKWSGLKIYNNITNKWENFNNKLLWNWFDNLLFLIFGGIPWQTYFQKVLLCKTTKIAFYLSFTSCLFCIMMSFPPLFVGIASKLIDWNNINIPKQVCKSDLTKCIIKSEYIFSLTLVKLLPSSFLFFCFGSIAASTFSSTDSSMLSAATMMSHNLYKNTIRPKASKRELSLVLKAVIILMGILAVGLSFLSNSAYGMWILSSDLVYVILFPRLCSVIYFNFTNSYGGIAGTIVGCLFRFLWGIESFHIKPVFKSSILYHENITIFPYKTLSMLLGFIVDLIVSKIAYYLFIEKKINSRYDIFRMLKSKDFIKCNI